ncbi:MAG: hypothetical protein KF760_26605 [Candidatus Eremiobacteraeota bacterium]|nr:hypothetical protein [Candidatus Eremiobacteraeota bacterium]MCW5871314.1 hypothetical protein [Candidatus Eremiobacteraeota bacterium]
MIKSLALLLALGLTGLAQAKPYSNRVYQFRADFPTEVGITREENWGQVFLSRPARYQSYQVTVLDRTRPRFDLLQMVRHRTGKYTEVELRDEKRQGRQVIYWSRIDDAGVPGCYLLLSTARHSYIVSAVGFDLGLQQRFLDSFSITP